MNTREYMDEIRRQQLEQIKNKIATQPSHVTPAMPSVLQMGKNLLNTTTDVVKGALNGEGVSLTEEQANARLDICKQCEFYVNERCSKCGCYMAVKTHLKAASCPVNKW